MALIGALFLLSLLADVSAFNNGPFDAYIQPWDNPNIDASALQICWITGGTFSEIETGVPVKGHKCTVEEEVWTDPSQAKDFCETRFPYHIIEAASNGAKTKCVFQVNLVCDRGWWQIDGKCYRIKELAGDKQYTFQEAKTECVSFEKSRGHKEPKLAEYYSHGLSFHLKHLVFLESWVTVPDWSPYYANVDDSVEGGVFVLDNSWKYDVEEGTLIIPDGQTRPALCQYTPTMTMGESFLLADIYKDIYPMFTSELGVTLMSAGYMTISQIGHSKYDSSEMIQMCKSIGMVLQVEAYPQASFENEYNVIKSSLTEHRFYLTGAVKQDGSKVTGYRDFSPADGSSQNSFDSEIGGDYSKAHSLCFNSQKRVFSTAGMRAPALCSIHSFKYERLPCDAAPADWHLVEYNRGENTICHYIHGKSVSHADAYNTCQQKDMQLSGFESQDEMTQVMNKIMSTSSLQNTEQYHYWLGGDVPCKSACNVGNNVHSVASWNPAVSVNNKFLHTYGSTSRAHPWNTEDGNEFISLRADVSELHTHNRNWIMGTICASYARNKPVKIDPRNTGSS